MVTAMTEIDAAKLIKGFLDGSCGGWEWDDFISIPQKNGRVEDIRQKVLQIGDEFPPQNSTSWSSDEGLRALNELAEEITARTD